MPCRQLVSVVFLWLKARMLACLCAARKHLLAPSEDAAQTLPQKKRRKQSPKEKIFSSLLQLYSTGSDSPPPDAAVLRALFTGDAGLVATFAAQRGSLRAHVISCLVVFNLSSLPSRFIFFLCV